MHKSLLREKQQLQEQELMQQLDKQMEEIKVQHLKIVLHSPLVKVILIMLK